MSKEQLPAIRYTTFIDAFEQMVAQKQREVKQLESSEAEYLACCDAIQKCPMPNDGRLALSPNGATITIQALPTDSSDTFKRLANAVAEALAERRLRESSDAASRDESFSFWQPSIRYYFYTNRHDGTMATVSITVSVPREGLRDLAVVESEHLSRDIVYTLEPRRQDHPPTLRRSESAIAF